MSKVPCQTQGMKIKKLRLRPALDEIIGHFGQVQLVKKYDGQHELVGGTEDQRRRVRQWCDQFASFLVFVDGIEEVVVVA